MRWWVVGFLIAVVAVTACTLDTPEQSGDETTDTVSISGSKFNPGTVRNVTGVAITFTNKDSTTHSVEWVSQPNGASLSDSLNLNSTNGKMISFTPLVAGTYTYQCGIHNSMKGTLVITTP